MRGGRILLGAASLVAGLLLCEALLSWLAPQVSRRPRLWQYDAQLGWRHIPGASGRMVGPEYDVEVRINADGLRARDYAREKESGVWRLLTCGDSFVEGWGVEAEQSVSAQLEQRLHSPTPGGAVEVINFGVAGYGTDQELLFFEELGRQYQPDQVVVFFYANDPINNANKKGIGAERGYKPYFRVDRQGQLRLRGVPVEEHPFWDPEFQESRPLYWRLGKYLFEHSHFFALAANTLNPPELDAGERERFYRALYGAGDDPPAAERWRLTGLILQAFKASAAQASAELVLVYVPAIVQLEDDDWRGKREIFGITGEFDLAKPNRELARLAAQHDIPLLDLSDGFKRGGGDQRLYFRESHWTPAGHALAARLVGDFLLERRASGPPSPQPQY